MKIRLKSSERAWARRIYQRTLRRTLTRLENIHYERYINRDLQGCGAHRSWLGEVNVVDWNR